MANDPILNNKVNKCLCFIQCTTESTVFKNRLCSTVRILIKKYKSETVVSLMYQEDSIVYADFGCIKVKLDTDQHICSSPYEPMYATFTSHQDFDNTSSDLDIETFPFNILHNISSQLRGMKIMNTRDGYSIRLETLLQNQ